MAQQTAQRKPERQNLPVSKPKTLPSIVHHATASGGQMLDAKTQKTMGAQFGHDFSQVRIHTNALASASADAVGANAYAVGSDIVFREGKYAPGTSETERLLAHELTHVVQQASGPVAGREIAPGVMVSTPGDLFEQAAERTASEVTRGAPVSAIHHPKSGSTSAAGTLSIQCDWADKALGWGSGITGTLSAGMAGQGAGTAAAAAAPWVAAPAAAGLLGMYAGKELYQNTQVGPDTDMWMKHFGGDPLAAGNEWDKGNYGASIWEGTKLGVEGLAAGTMGLMTGGIGYPIFHDKAAPIESRPDPNWPPPDFPTVDLSGAGS